MADDFLVQHAYLNAWCAPEQDKPAILRPKRISPKNGARVTMDILRAPVRMPDNTNFWHVYQIGDISPEILGIADDINAWISLKDHMNHANMIIDLYTAKGRMLPRYRSYLLRTRDRNVLLAVMDDTAVADLNNEHAFIKFYSGAYFKQPENQLPDEGVLVRGMTIKTNEEQYALQQQWRISKSLKGGCYAYVNGLRVHDLNPSTVKIGDRVEYIWDSSIKRIVRMKASELPQFNSDLDRKAKLLLHYPNGRDEVIDYRDDVDVHLLKVHSAGIIYSGLYYNKNFEDTLRMVTHKDYSLPKTYLAGYVQDNPGMFAAVEDMTIELIIRDGGIDKHLIGEHHRIRELYKLSEEKLLLAMTGVDSSMPVWTANSLESSAYPKLLRSHLGNITRSMVEEAYGYNAISAIIADTPQKVQAGQQWVLLPVGLQQNATIYEYDAAGKLLKYYYHSYGQYYPIRDLDNCRMIEGIVGRGSSTLSTEYAQLESVLDETFNYRFYTCPIVNGEPTGAWKDVTGDTSLYTLTGNTLFWKTDPLQVYTAVKNDSDFIAYDLNLNYREGVLRFTINVNEIRSDGVQYPGKAEIPPGIVEVWVEGRPLIRDLDFFVNWPEICLVNKEYLAPGAAQRISIRARGFCLSDMTMEPIPDFGFVEYGMLSHNSRYDVRDDKVVRIVVDGYVYDREDLVFSEDNDLLRLADPASVRNGAPYQITDPAVSIKRVCDADTYVLRAQSQQVDRWVSDYLTRNNPEKPQPNPNPIPRLYDIYSPFCGRLISDLQLGILSTDDVEGTYGDALVKEKLTPYEWLLEYEPTYRDIDWNYVNVHPHNHYTVVTLNVYQYRFLLRAIRFYLDDKVDITKFVKIETGFEHETPDHPHPYRVLP